MENNISVKSYKKIVIVSLLISTASYLVGAALNFFITDSLGWGGGFYYIFLSIGVAPVSPGMLVFLLAAVKGAHFGQILTIFGVNFIYHNILYILLKNFKIKLTLRGLVGIGFGLFLLIISVLFITGAGSDGGALITYLFPIFIVILIVFLRRRLRK